MTDHLAVRITDNQIRMATDDLKRAAARLARDAAHHSEAMGSGTQLDSGAAWRLAQDALDLARQAAKLDGMRTIADLHRGEKP